MSFPRRLRDAQTLSIDQHEQAGAAGLLGGMRTLMQAANKADDKLSTRNTHRKTVDIRGMKVMSSRPTNSQPR
jgi:hypothetical protein